MKWQEVLNTARECKRVWGMGFPVISIKLLEPYWEAVEAELRTLRADKENAHMLLLLICREAIDVYYSDNEIGIDANDAEVTDEQWMSALERWAATLAAAKEKT